MKSGPPQPRTGADHWTGLVKRILLVLAALASAPPALAQNDDKAYCTQLSELYRRYVQNATGRRVDVEALHALDEC